MNFRFSTCLACFSSRNQPLSCRRSAVHERDRFKPADRSTMRYFTPDDFSYDAATSTCRCPAGKLMWRRVTARPMGQHRYDIFQWVRGAGRQDGSFSKECSLCHA
jgi:hypothetical protein